MPTALSLRWEDYSKLKLLATQHSAWRLLLAWGPACNTVLGQAFSGAGPGHPGLRKVCGRKGPARANSQGPAPAQEYAGRGGDPVPRWESCQALQEGEGLQRPHLPPSSQTSWIRLDSPAS
ncbi:dexamethasone-induced protein isoform X1 [Alexandromys fortis]|uniref:dexamethasone-induced protein isoform X1 n=1 Tax=Alexandromys fortis TaxID=100897 RepID=UPI002152D60B|nr:dexamethasone-induced protein isoform X1 [Microtus fortis]